jgi:hypothetical protein
MKNFIFIASILGLASCSLQKDASEKNLLKISDFSIVTQSRDTLYLMRDHEIAEHIKKCWDNGSYRYSSDSVYTHVIMLEETQFAEVSKRCSLQNENQEDTKGLTQLTNSYRN